MRDMELCRTMPGGVSPGTASAPVGSATALAAVVNLRRTRPRRMGPELRAGGRGERGGRGFRDRARRRGGRMRSRADASYPRRAGARGKGSRTRRRLGRPRRPRPGRAAPRERGPRGRRGGTRARARAEPRRAAFAAPVRGSRPTDDASARTPRALLARRVVHIDMVHDDACVRRNADRGRSVEWRGWCGSDASYALRSPAGAR